MQATFSAPDIECDGCAASIQRALGQAPGVHNIYVDVAAKTICVDFDPKATNTDSLSSLLDEIGFPVS